MIRLRSRLLLLGLCFTTVGLAVGCGGPTPGGSCDTTVPVCADPRAALTCVNGVWLKTPCAGPQGCIEANGRAQCDDSTALSGTPCLRPLGLACAQNGAELLQCLNGTWSVQSTCTSCLAAGGSPTCSFNATNPNPPTDGGVVDGGADAGHDAGIPSDGGHLPTDGGLPPSDGGVDPCAGIPVGGRCKDPQTAEYCVVTSGSGQPTPTTLTCGPGTVCEGSSGNAKCVSTGVCTEGETRCNGTTLLETCQNGQWAGMTCPNGCSSSAVGAFCETAGGTTTFSGKVTYERKAPNASLTDWSNTVQTVSAPGFLVISVAGGQTLDAVVTDNAGAFTVKVPTQPQTNDAVYVIAASTDANGQIDLIVASPNMGMGTLSPGVVPSSPQMWGWAWDTSSLPASGVLHVTVADGSGAARVFDITRQVRNAALGRYGTAGSSLIVWLDYGTSWSCGACFAPHPITSFNTPFSTQVWFSGDSDEQYWSDAVIAHELGHWWMESFGTSPQEGGIHVIGVPAFPGLAWSEGWASFVSADIRNDKLYVDKQGGGLFWLDIAARTYSNGGTFIRGDPSKPLIQLMDEFEVTAILWELRNASASNAASLYAALQAPKMNKSPWARGYTRHTWDYSNGQYFNVVNTGQARPFVADFFDTLMCSGFSAQTMNTANDPTTAYPYPANAPLCQ